MSHAGRIIGIPGLEIERVVRRKGIEVWAKPVHRPPCKHCQGNGLRIKATHLRTVKHTRQGTPGPDVTLAGSQVPLHLV